MRTTFPSENGDTTLAPKENQNISGQVDGENEQSVKFPKRLRVKKGGKVLATIYRLPNQAQPFRLYWRARVTGCLGAG